MRGMEATPPQPPPPPEPPAPTPTGYPVTFSVDYPDRTLDRVSSAFRIFTVIPIAIVLAAIVGFSVGGDYDDWAGTGSTIVVTGTGLLALPVALMLIFRRKYPRWWYDWNLELQRFISRVDAYVLLMDDRYPSTDDHQSVHLDFPYPDAERELSQFMPLVKWLLAIPHYIVLFFLGIGAFFVAVYAWFAILFTGRYPRGAFDYIEGVLRWGNRVLGYAWILVTDEYPPFRLRP
jgi:hypothetical protein